MGVLKEAKVIVNNNRQKLNEFNKLLQDQRKLGSNASFVLVGLGGTGMDRGFNEEIKDGESKIRAKAKEIIDNIPEVDYLKVKKASTLFNRLFGGNANMKIAFLIEKAKRIAGGGEIAPEVMEKEIPSID